MTAAAITLFTWDGETATVNLGGILLLVALVALAWSLFR